MILILTMLLSKVWSFLTNRWWHFNLLIHELLLHNWTNCKFGCLARNPVLLVTMKLSKSCVSEILCISSSCKLNTPCGTIVIFLQGQLDYLFTFKFYVPLLISTLYDIRIRSCLSEKTTMCKDWIEVGRTGWVGMTLLWY